MLYKYLTTAFLIANFFLSLPLWHVIYKHISKKPILSVSLVDLIYRDTIFYIISLSFFISTGIIHTLMYDGENFRLSYELALIHSIAVNVSLNAICFSLIFTAGLRLISLVKNSEAAGEAYFFLVASLSNCDLCHYIFCS